MQQLKFFAKAEIAKENLANTIAKKAGIALPSSHLAILVASLAPLDKPNKNGVRLSKEASEKFLKTIHQAQVNFSHNGAWFVNGAVIDEWIDYESQETKVAFTFYKELYPKEYTKLLEAQTEGTLGISFELLADMDATDKLNDGTVLVNSFEYTGIGLLGVIDDKSPAYEKGRIHEFASTLKDRVNNCSYKELIHAELILDNCKTVLDSKASEVSTTNYLLCTSGTSSDSNISITLENETTEIDDEQNKILSDEEIEEFISEMRKTKKKPENKKKWKKDQGGEKPMTEEQKNLVAQIRAELDGFIPKELKDEELLDEKKVAEYRQAKLDAEKAKKEADEKAAKVSAESKSLSQETYTTVKTYKDDGSVETMNTKDCMYKFVDSEGKTQTEHVMTNEAMVQMYSEEQLKANETKISELESEVLRLKSEMEIKDKELNDFREEKAARLEAEKKAKIEEIKATLKENKYVADFKDEDFLNADKVENAKVLQERDDLKAEVEALKKGTKVEAAVIEEKPKTKIITKASDNSEELDVTQIIRKMKKKD